MRISIRKLIEPKPKLFRCRGYKTCKKKCEHAKHHKLNSGCFLMEDVINLPKPYNECECRGVK